MLAASSGKQSILSGKNKKKQTKKAEESCDIL